MLDVWVCSTCHSLNRERATSCYKCGSRREAATGEGAFLRQARAITERVDHGFRSSVEVALLAGFLVLGVAALQIYATVVETADVATFTAAVDAAAAGGPLDIAGLQATLDAHRWLDVASFGVGLAALVAFGAWLAIGVSNAPLLGGGVPRVTPLRAFVLSIIPVVNIRRVPQIVLDLLYRLDPRRGGVFIVGLAWACFGGSWIVGRLEGFYLSLRIADAEAEADSLASFSAALKPLLQTAFLIDVVVSALIAFGALILVVIIVDVERRVAERDREIQAALQAAR